MAFPSSPSNGQTAVVNGIVYAYSSTTTSWTRQPNTITTLTTGNVITSNGVFWANGSAYGIGGMTSYSGNSAVVATYTTAATTANTGALQIMGGVGVAGNIIAGGQLQVLGAGTVASGLMSDLTTSPATIAFNGAATTSATKPPGATGTSLYFPNGAATDYVAVGTSSKLALAGDYTIECWFMIPVGTTQTAYANLYGSPVFYQQLATAWGGTTGWDFYDNRSGGPGSLFSAASLVDGNWHHIAVSRIGSTVRLFGDGSLITSGTSTDTVDVGATGLAHIGAGTNGGSDNPFKGYIFNFRVSNTARYTSGFTPSVTYTVDTSSVLFIGAGSSTAGTQSTSTTTGALTVNGGAGINGNVFAGNVLASGFFYANGSAYGSAVAGLTSYSGNSSIVITSTTASTSNSSGALQVVGGVGVQGNMYIGGGNGGANDPLGRDIHVSGRIFAGVAGQGYPYVSLNQDMNGTWNPGVMFGWTGQFSTGINIANGGTQIDNTQCTTNQPLKTTNSTTSSSTTTGALIVAGGAGIAGAINVGGSLNKYAGINVITQAEHVVTAVGSVSSSTYSFDLSLSNYFTISTTSACTFTFSTSNAQTSYLMSFVIRLTPSSTITWPSSVIWPTGVAPTLTTGSTHLCVFTSDNGGTTWRGVAVTGYAS
jgi:hypothetical protein